MSEKNRSTARDLPLARPVNEPQLARPVSGEPEEAGRAEEQQQAPRAREQEESTRAEEEQPESAPAEGEQGEQGEKGLIDRAVDEARERGLVSGQTADEIREKSKSFIEKVKDRLSGR